MAMLLAFRPAGYAGSLPGPTGDFALPFTTAAVSLCAGFCGCALLCKRSAKLGFMSVAREYEEISETLGLSPWRTFLKLTLPLAAPSLLTGTGAGMGQGPVGIRGHHNVRRQPDGQDPDHAPGDNDSHGDEPGHGSGAMSLMLLVNGTTGTGGARNSESTQRAGSSGDGDGSWCPEAFHESRPGLGEVPRGRLHPGRGMGGGAGADIDPVRSQSGAGKTTLLKAVAGLIRPQEGHIRNWRTE